MRMIDNIPVYGTLVDEGALAQIKTCARMADRVALMADHHKGYAVPIGGVVAYADAISPSGVGYDIACGNKAVLTDASAEEVKRDIGVIMDRVWSTISFGIGRKNDDERVDHDLFDDPAWSIEACKPLKEMARQQLGTVGSGNHYVDIFEDEQGRVWIGVHFSSRGLGHKTATWFLRAAGASDGMDVEPCILPVSSDLGAQYLEGMRLGGRYAYAGRDWVCTRVARLLPESSPSALGSRAHSLGSAQCDPINNGKIQQTETIMYQNKVTLIGFLGSNPEVRTNNNRSFTTLSLATKSSYKKDDKYISHTEWHRCVVFGKLSEFAKTLTKGAHIQVEGELRSREYTSKKTDSKQRVWEIRVASILKLDRAEKAAPDDQEKDQEHDESPPEETAA